MKWSWKIGRLAGIDVYVHATFLLLLVWIGMSSLVRGEGWGPALAIVGFVLAVFGTVVLHELGHALAARQFGIKTRDITLLPIGGIARLARMPEDPQHELLVAIAGPAVNVAIAGVLFAGLALFGQEILLASDSFTEGSFFANLAWINLAIAAFNLIPAFPLDGGRVFRALLAMWTDYLRATRTAAAVGRALAILLGVFGFFTNPILILVALFVWVGATSEAAATEMKAALQFVPVSSAMATSFLAISPSDSVKRAAELALQGFQQEFPVVDDARTVVGVLTRANLLKALSQNGGDTRVRNAMDLEFPVAEHYEMLSDVLPRLGQASSHVVLVMHQRKLVGLVTMARVGELVAAREQAANAVEHGAAPRLPPRFNPWWERAHKPQ